MKLKAILGLPVLSIIFSGVAFASSGPFEVTQAPSGCSYFVVEQGFEYVLLENWSCPNASRGDRGSGTLDGWGMRDIEINSITCNVYVEDFMLSESSAQEKLLQKCP